MQLPGHLFAALWVAGLFSFSLCQDNCKVLDGKPGQAGVPGRNGWPGQKGEKGEAALQVQLSKEVLDGLKGDEGEQGSVGEIGVKGYQGFLGPPGPAGPPGPSGGSGGFAGAADASKAAFSVLRTTKETPSYNKPVTFNKELTNVNKDFDINDGIFNCKIAGVYYFVFHSVSEDSLCLKLMSDCKPEVGLAFCDFTQPKKSHVLSGGAVLKLSQGDKVWIEPFKNLDHTQQEFNKMTGESESSAVFNGFLIFPTG